MAAAVDRDTEKEAKGQPGHLVSCSPVEAGAGQGGGWAAWACIRSAAGEEAGSVRHMSVFGVTKENTIGSLI